MCVNSASTVLRGAGADRCSGIDVLDRVQEVFAVLVVFEYGLFLVATGCYVIDRTGIFYS